MDADCLALVDEIIGDVSMYYFIDLSEKEFYVRFALHIKNLLARARTESFARNPLTDEIKSSCPLLYDTAVGSAGIIKRQVWNAHFETLAEAVAVADAEMHLSQGSEDFKEGSATSWKRGPSFSGR